MGGDSKGETMVQEKSSRTGLPNKNRGIYGDIRRSKKIEIFRTEHVKNRKARKGLATSILISAAFFVIVLIVFYPAITSADTVGLEWRINNTFLQSQTAPSIAMTGGGQAVVTWESDGLDGNDYGVFGQRINDDGSFLGNEFQVNTYTNGRQGSSAVTANSSGHFIVVWESILGDGSGYGVYGQRYDNSGVAVGSEFLVNNFTTNDQRYPSVAMNESGEFVIVWQSSGQDGDGLGVFAKRYLSNGSKIGGEFQVNSYNSSDQVLPDISMSENGSFIITWSSYGQDSSEYGIYAQRYLSNGSKIGGEFQVNSYTSAAQFNSEIAVNESGEFVIVWQSYGQDGDGFGIYAQKFYSNGSAMGSEFLVNVNTTSNQAYSSVAIAPNGRFVVTWASQGQDSSGFGVYAREFNLSGTSYSEFQVNTYTTNTQYMPAIAMNPQGKHMIVWASDGQDSSSYGIYGQRYDNIPIMIPEFNDIVVPIAGLMLIALIFGRARKKKG